MTKFTDWLIQPNNEHMPDLKIGVISNVWIKLMKFNKTGDYIPGHKHTFNHASILSAGSVEVEVDSNKTTFIAPAIIYIEKDKQHKITALEPNSVVSCIHGLRDADKTDDLITEDMVPKGANPSLIFRDAELNLAGLIKE